MNVRRPPHVLVWSNPVARWWGLLTLVSLVNIAVWFVLYRNLHEPKAGSIGGSFGIELMLTLCAAYVFGCAFRSLLPRADVQRICLFDTWLSSVMVGRTVATVAEVCFAMQWAIILHRLGTMTGADTTQNAALAIVPLILIAEIFSWYAVLTRKYWANAVENSIWAVAFFIVGLGLFRLLPEFEGLVRFVLAIAIVGIAGYLAFLATVDVPMYLKRWRAETASGAKPLRPMEGLRDVSVRWVVTREHLRVEGGDALDVALFQRRGLGEPRLVRGVLAGKRAAALSHCANCKLDHAAACGSRRKCRTQFAPSTGAQAGLAQRRRRSRYKAHGLTASRSLWFRS